MYKEVQMPKDFSKAVPATDDSWNTIEEPLEDALRLAEEALSKTTGHDDFQRRKIAYWIIATHFLPVFDPFPTLVVYGPPATGKSATLEIVYGFSYKPTRIAGATTSAAGLRSAMGEAARGTLIIEEADKLATQELEDILITRYSLASGIDTKMVTPGQGIWRRQKVSTSGATALHRRNLFKDPALLRRTIPIRAKRTKGKYVPPGQCKGLFDEFHQLEFTRSTSDAKGISTGDKLPKLLPVENIWGVDQGILDCFMPILALAVYLEDRWFINQLKDEMKEAESRLKGEELYLEAPALLHILICLAAEEMGKNFTAKRISVEVSKIEPAGLREYGRSCPLLSLSANQRNRILREDLGFEVASAGGRQRVRFTIAELIKQCSDWKVVDEQLDTWDNMLKEMESKAE
jgi:hypothetical protein